MDSDAYALAVRNQMSVQATSSSSYIRLIENIREEAGFKPEDPLKFASKTRPEHVYLAKHTAAKQALVEA